MTPAFPLPSLAPVQHTGTLKLDHLFGGPDPCGVIASLVSKPRGALPTHPQGVAYS